LSLAVQDDGRGFDPSEDAGLGILGMRERVMHLAGKLEVNSRPGKGTIVALSLPLPAGHRSAGTYSEDAYQEIRPFRTA
jgi:glucose-6-phosphate-specific signal transduction histidine kinase